MQVTGVVLSQFVFAHMVRNWSWGWVLLLGWLLSGTLNQNLFTAQHEISHFLAFRSPGLNRALALFANLPLIIPVAVKFREYHHDHHIFLVGGPAVEWRSVRGGDGWVLPGGLGMHGGRLLQCKGSADGAAGPWCRSGGGGPAYPNW